MLLTYIHLFSQKRNELPSVSDIDVIQVSIGNTTYKRLVHTLHQRAPHTMRKLLDIAMDYAIGEETIDANFNERGKASAQSWKPEDDNDDGSSS